MNREIREAIRYLGYGRHAIDEQTLALVECSMEELKAKVRERFIHRIFELSQKDGVLQIGDWTIESKGLSRNLKGCGRVAAFAATLGTEADQMIRRASVMEMAKAVVLQSCAAALLEEYCDDCQEEIAKELSCEGWYLRPRFSPGYGDFDIRHQEKLLALLQADKKIGLTMTKSCMLTPTKSVTALIGISREQIPCHRQGCEVCEKADCLYRRA